MKWQDKLTKAELKHVREWVGSTLKEVKSMMAIHKERRKEKGSEGIEPCFICRSVARKLGLDV